MHLARQVVMSACRLRDKNRLRGRNFKAIAQTIQGLELPRARYSPLLLGPNKDPTQLQPSAGRAVTTHKVDQVFCTTCSA